MKPGTISVMVGPNLFHNLRRLDCIIKVIQEEDSGKIDMEQAFIQKYPHDSCGPINYLIGAVLIVHSEKKRRLGASIAKTVFIKAR